MRILVVDDSADTADTLAQLLKMDGHDAHIAYDGLAALAVIDQHPPDVVFLDLGLPVLSGIEVANRIRKERGLDRVALIAMTGHGLIADHNDTRDCGFDHHLTKPTPYEAVKALLDRIAAERNRG